jgi:arylsulfatase
MSTSWKAAKGEKSRELVVYDLDQRRLIDAEITRRTIDFMKRSVEAGQTVLRLRPLYARAFPVSSEQEVRGHDRVRGFPGRSCRNGLQRGRNTRRSRFSEIRDNTIFVFTSDNGPEATWPWQGTSGPWRGYYFTHMEGSLRVPFIIRWPGKIPEGRVSNEIVHEVDTFTTFATIAGVEVPQDRPIDGVDQTDFLLGKSESSNRESIPIFVADRLEAVKWRNWKVVFYEAERDWWSTPTKLGSPKAFDLITDPKEEYPQTGLPKFVDSRTGE